LEVAVFGVLLIVIYLIVLNGFLNGLYKTRIDAILTCALLAILAISFGFFGWKSGLTSIAFCLITPPFVRPAARGTARFMFAHPPKHRPRG
jgi:hypothetical protein